MAYGLDSAREQLQWRLIYARKNSHTALAGSPGCFHLLDKRPVSSVRTETTEADAATNAQSVSLY